jgi:hypothetical protein
VPRGMVVLRWLHSDMDSRSRSGRQHGSFRCSFRPDPLIHWDGFGPQLWLLWLGRRSAKCFRSDALIEARIVRTSTLRIVCCFPLGMSRQEATAEALCYG